MQYESEKATRKNASPYPRFALGMCLALVAVSAVTGCATTGEGMPDIGKTTAYVYGEGDGLAADFAPIFLVEHDEQSYNKVGTPSARYTETGREDIFVDSSIPTIYHQTRTFQTEKGEYTNLIYRVHFERSPFTWKPFNASAGRNVGAMAVVTLNENQQPIYLTTVQSCGCYHVITPTSFLDANAYPDDWDADGVTVYGEDLPGRLTYPEPFATDSRIVIVLRNGTHRTKDILIARLEDLEAGTQVVRTRAAKIETLKSLKLSVTSTSFYHTKGRKRGLVKGARKPWETLIFGIVAWDANVGQDREYASKDDSGHRFYTTLRANQKKRSDMWDYAGYLRNNGWKP